MSSRLILRRKSSKDNPSPEPIGISRSVNNSNPTGPPGPPGNRSPPKFWVQDPTILFRNFAIVPNARMTEAERFNAMTRLILIIALILFFIPVASWLVFLLCGAILLAVLYSATRSSKIENYRYEIHPKTHPPREESCQKKRRKFSLRPR